jgi:transcriptional antiterminator RfaH
MSGERGELAMSWFVCQTHVREEDRARHYLEEKGFGVYVPMMEIQKTLGSRVALVRRPLFPSYLFVRFEKEEQIPFVRWTRGVRRILPESIHPILVEDRVVETFRVLEQRDGIIRKNAFVKNDRVRILRGPFKELSGIFEAWASDRGRVRVLLQFVNFQARIELHQSLLEKVA